MFFGGGGGCGWSFWDVAVFLSESSLSSIPVAMFPMPSVTRNATARQL